MPLLGHSCLASLPLSKACSVLDGIISACCFRLQDFWNIDASDPLVHSARFFYGPMLQVFLLASTLHVSDIVADLFPTDNIHRHSSCPPSC
jgi:hypothetical protein